MSELLDWAFRGKRSGQATGHKPQIKGYKLKDGKLVKDEKRLDVSARLRQRNSKKVRVTRRGTP